MKSHFTHLPVMLWLGVCLIMASPAGAQLCWHNGDAILDGYITSGDAQLAFQIALLIHFPTYEESCAADCNGNGTVTAGDAQSIFLLALGMGVCSDPLEPPAPTATPGGFQAGDLYSNDAILGNMRYVPKTGPGGFTQGSPADEPCRYGNERQFTHVLTRNLAVMETEAARQMWSDLRALQPTLPPDPSDILTSPSMMHPVQHSTWFEVILFANLLSLQNGYTRCYYKNEGFTIPVESTNYFDEPVYCRFDADGYRLLTEGEWEYCCRAGTGTAFSCLEPNYNNESCDSCQSEQLPDLEECCIFCANSIDFSVSEIVGSKLANPWGFKDMHGNVYDWCWDWLGAYPASGTDYTGAATGIYRVRRGGCLDSYPTHCRSAFREGAMPEIDDYRWGFRLARTIP
jgi:formylglycine-generating enzyme required for sulfatase activity